MLIHKDDSELHPKIIVDEVYIRATVESSHKRNLSTCNCGARFPESLSEEKLEALFRSHLDYVTRNLLHLKAAK